APEPAVPLTPPLEPPATPLPATPLPARPPLPAAPSPRPVPAPPQPRATSIRIATAAVGARIRWHSTVGTWRRAPALRGFEPSFQLLEKRSPLLSRGARAVRRVGRSRHGAGFAPNTQETTMRFMIMHKNDP